MEEWRDIQGYDGFYQVSNCGRVRSMYFHNNHATIKRVKVLKTVTNKSNRVYVSLHNDGKRKNCTVHRLVACAFLPNPDQLPEVNHIDGNPSNNNVENLEWCTKKYNAQHAYDNDLNHFKSYNESIKKKVIRDDGVVYPSIRECARANGVTQMTLKGAIFHRKNQRFANGHEFRLMR